MKKNNHKMDDGIYKLGPVYNSKVKISDWYEGLLQYPLDNPCTKSDQHYKTFGPTDEFFIPKTSTKEMMEQGLSVHQISTKGLKHPMINFTSYPLIDNDKIFGNERLLNMAKRKSEELPLVTIYQRSYGSRKSLKSKKKCCNDLLLHPLLNRIPKNDFEMASVASENKFMDDHFFNTTEQKKCVNFLRQMRSISYIPWLGEYQKPTQNWS